MPLVKPNNNEQREDFMSRCMSDDKTTSEYPATDQRLAVCSSQYENRIFLLFSIFILRTTYS